MGALVRSRVKRARVLDGNRIEAQTAKVGRA